MLVKLTLTSQVLINILVDLMQKNRKKTS